MIPKVEACLTSLEAGRPQDPHHRRPAPPLAAAGDLHRDRRRHRDRQRREPRPARPRTAARPSWSASRTEPPVDPVLDRNPRSAVLARRPLPGSSCLGPCRTRPPELGRDDRPVRAVRDRQLPPLPGLPGAGRGLVGLGRRGEPLPRLLPRLGLQPAGPLPAAGGRGGPRAGRAADPRAEHLVHGAAGGVRPGALGAVASAAASASSATAAPRPTRRPSSWPGPTGTPRAGTRSSRWRAASTAGPTPR